VKAEITELQKLMAERDLGAYYVPSGDPHGSECFASHYACREYLTGLTGETGELIVTPEGAYLWTDGRYFLQAEIQLEGSGIELMKIGEEGVPTIREFLAARASDKGPFVLGFDGTVIKGNIGSYLEQSLQPSGVTIEWDMDLAGEIWQDRPDIVPGRIFELPLSSAGVSPSTKLMLVRKEMRDRNVTHMLITDLTEIAWLLNLRGSDIAYTPVFYSYLLLGSETCTLFVMDGALEDDIADRIKAEVPELFIRDYSEIYHAVSKLPEGSIIMADPSSANFALLKSVPEGVRLSEHPSPVASMKTVKNVIEIGATRGAHIHDGAAVVKFIKWIKENAAGGEVTEITAAEHLNSLRLSYSGCFDLSFETISGYGPNASIIHYAPAPETCLTVEPRGFLLVDSGGQYYDGTTDITRTIALGPLTPEEIKAYTLVLKAHISLARSRMHKNTDGVELDNHVRMPMNEAGYDFNHGLSHGVGHVLSVHEGPNYIARKRSNVPVKAGMIMSDEPGIYVDRVFGVRIENELLTRQANDGTFYFENLTFAPYEREAIDIKMLTDEEIAWIDDYHETVYRTLRHFLTTDEKLFLEKVTAPLISRE
jgi:Xaa-Pro aminopeptidase